MITFSQLGKKGNLGNQLFQIASTIGIASRVGHEYFFPIWQYSKYFENSLPTFNTNERFSLLTEKKYEYHDWVIGKGNYDINGWLQSEKYFEVDKTKKAFTFKTNIQNELIKSNSNLFSRKTILISVRRGDFVNNSKYFQLSYKYYLLALYKYFPDKNTRNIIFMSDDINYCRHYFGFLKNSFFINNLSAIEQLMIANKCDDFIISNSTFSWWAAWLGENENSKIICPVKNFGETMVMLNDKDYYPDQWMKFDSKVKTKSITNLSLIFRITFYSWTWRIIRRVIKTVLLTN